MYVVIDYYRDCLLIFQSKTLKKYSNLWAYLYFLPPFLLASFLFFFEIKF